MTVIFGASVETITPLNVPIKIGEISPNTLVDTRSPNSIPDQSIATPGVKRNK